MDEQLKTLVVDDTVYETKLTKKFAKRKMYAPPDKSLITAFIPGVIKQIYVQPKQTVKPGDSLLILEAMKMKNDVKAHIGGVIKSINVKLNEMVPKGLVLIELDIDK